MAIPYIRISHPEVVEGGNLTATVSVFGEVPTTMRYRVDCGTTQEEVRGWTDLTPAATVSISLDYSDNAIVSDASGDERKVITVETDTGLATQNRTLASWIVMEQFAY